MCTISTEVKPQIEEVITTKYCFYCTEIAVGLDVEGRCACDIPGCSKAVAPLPNVESE